MNIVEQVQVRLKEEIKAAVIKAGLATEDKFQMYFGVTKR